MPSETTWIYSARRATAASLLAELGEPEAIRKEVMGHRNIATTQRYTHFRPVHEIPAHGRLADAVPIAGLVTAARKRASGKPVGKNVGTEKGHSHHLNVGTESAVYDNHA